MTAPAWRIFLRLLLLPNTLPTTAPAAALASVDPMDDDFQWLTVSGGWTTGTNWLKKARFGYRRNLVGSELTYLSAGVTAFRWFNVDVATAGRRAEIKGNRVPRGLILSLGFQVDF